ncbi:MAG: response regulator [Bacteriovoracaceae bacterium]
MSEPHKCILLVDDEAEIRDVLKDFIQHEYPAYQVLEANDGVEAIKCINKQKFSLIICDLKMPKANGMEVMKHLTNNVAEEYKPNQVIVLSGLLSDSQLQKLNSGTVRFMQKPFKQDELKIYLDSIL